MCVCLVRVSSRITHSLTNRTSPTTTRRENITADESLSDPSLGVYLNESGPYYGVRGHCSDHLSHVSCRQAKMETVPPTVPSTKKIQRLTEVRATHTFHDLDNSPYPSPYDVAGCQRNDARGSRRAQRRGERVAFLASKTDSCSQNSSIEPHARNGGDRQDSASRERDHRRTRNLPA